MSVLDSGTPAALPATDATVTQGAPSGAPPAQSTAAADPAVPAVQESAPAKDWWTDILGADDPLASTAKRYTDPKAVVQALAEAQRAIRESGKVKLPGKDAKPEDVAAFNKAIGVPESVDDYKVFDGLPKDTLIGDADRQMITSLVADMHKAGGFQAHPDVVRLVPQLYDRVMQEQAAQMAAAAAAQVEQTRTALKQEWGNAYDNNLTYAKGALQQFFGNASQSIADLVLADGTILGDHPDFLRGLAQAGRLTGEDSLHFAAAGMSNAGSAEDVEARIKTIAALRYSNPAEYQRREPEYQRLLAARETMRARART